MYLYDDTHVRLFYQKIEHGCFIRVTALLEYFEWASGNRAM